MTDHKAKAELIATTGVGGIKAYMIEGLIHATLALAEQQRIGNLIAYLALPESAHERESRAHKEIEDGLGLS